MPKAQFAMTKGHCCIRVGVWGRCEPPSGSRAEPWWGSRGRIALEAEKIWHFTISETAKNKVSFEKIVIGVTICR